MECASGGLSGSTGLSRRSAPCNAQRATRNAQRAIRQHVQSGSMCNRQHVQHARYNIQQAACHSMKCNGEHYNATLEQVCNTLRATCNRPKKPAVRPLRVPVGLGSVCVGAAHGTVNAARRFRGRPRPCQVFDAASSPGAIQRALDAADCDVLSSLAETPAAEDGAADGHE
jgi:hypothetical protein